MRYFLGFVFAFMVLLGSAQDSTYFNKLILPYTNSTINIRSIVKLDTIYYSNFGWLSNISDTNQCLGIIKTCTNGNIINVAKWGDTTNAFYSYPNNSLICTSDSCFMIAAVSMSPNKGTIGYLMKVNRNLDTVWTKTFTHPDTLAASQPGVDIFNTLTAIRETYDSGFIISGIYNKNCVQGDLSGYLMKVDSIGNLLWINTYGSNTTIYDIELSADSGFYFPSVFNNSMKAVKTDKYGNVEWTTNVNSNSNPSNPMDLEILDSNYIYVTSAYWYDLVYNKRGINLCKINTNTHTKLWEKNYILFNNFKSVSLHQSIGLDILPLGDIVISGTSNMVNPDNSQEIAHKGVLIKLNGNGDSLWSRRYGYGLFKDDCQFNDIVLTDDGGFLAVGWQWHPQSGIFYQNAWLVKMDSMGCDTAGCDIYDAINQLQIRPNINMKLYPNPTSDYFRISTQGVGQLHNLWLRIYDMQGREVQRVEIQNSQVDKLIEVRNLQTGVYSVSLYSGSVLLAARQLEVLP